MPNKTYFQSAQRKKSHISDQAWKFLDGKSYSGCAGHTGSIIMYLGIRVHEQERDLI